MSVHWALTPVLKFVLIHKAPTPAAVGLDID